MSYPPPRWTAAEGVVNARYRPADAPPDLVSETTEVGYLATQVTSNGEFGLYHYAMTGPPGGPAPHFHRTISESFYVLSGTIRLYDGEEWVDATGGDFLHVPVGGIHAFRNESGVRAEMLLMFHPGAPRESYFEAVVEKVAQGWSPTPQERDAFYAEHDQFWA